MHNHSQIHTFMMHYIDDVTKNVQKVRKKSCIRTPFQILFELCVMSQIIKNAFYKEGF